ncbi:polyprenyl synthetase family protein [Amylibacter sp.]|nr:polyprenyl synthetase family protein [Rhodobacterales bacterium]MDA8756965.1 polyprenyl synthetase family protein [Amylibacter sp.]MDA9585556.1 polyprenyl synthetase family protein [Amylibacter sp.]MDB2523745.1 polyprenyl synthetase family protein [Amylibacter sp.]MDB2563386.1 polyprenyl synthetase family protein [Amylibacter sp.]
MLNFNVQLNDTASIVEIALKEMLQKQGNDLMSAPIRHAVLNGGKRLRAFLVIHSCNIFEVQKDTAIQAAIAIECLHAYSLVHDDLPCMDDDELRRGKPTVHVKWDEATATLTGDALQALAFELIASLPHTDAIRIVELLKKLAKASGMQGMVLGQAQDIQAEKSKVNLNINDITSLQQNKTGALIEWSAISGAILSNQDDRKLLDYAKSIGLAFQIQDDILDIEGDAVLAGKRLQKDVSAGKATFVSLLGIEDARLRAKELIEEAIDALSDYGDKAEPMRQVAKFIIERKM